MEFYWSRCCKCQNLFEWVKISNWILWFVVCILKCFRIRAATYKNEHESNARICSFERISCDFPCLLACWNVGMLACWVYLHHQEMHELSIAMSPLTCRLTIPFMIHNNQPCQSADWTQTVSLVYHICLDCIGNTLVQISKFAKWINLLLTCSVTWGIPRLHIPLTKADCSIIW